MTKLTPTEATKLAKDVLDGKVWTSLAMSARDAEAFGETDELFWYNWSALHTCMQAIRDAEAAKPLNRVKRFFGIY